jgi:hypothetical protein
VRPVTGTVELRQLESVDVQQRPGLGPLIALAGLRVLRAPLAADAMAPKHLPDRRPVPAGQPRQSHRPPVGLGAGIEDHPFLLGAQRLRTRPRHRWTRRAPHPAGPVSLRRGQPAPAGGRHRRRRAPHRSRDRSRLLAGEQTQHQLALRARSETTSTVQHVRSSLGARVLADPNPPTEAGRPLSTVQQVREQIN